jgi:hypothetical protein
MRRVIDLALSADELPAAATLVCLVVFLALVVLAGALR